MTEQEKLQKIENLVDQIAPINYERIMLETRLYVIEKQPDTHKEEISQIKQKLSVFYSELDPLFKQLRSLQSEYEVVYQGQLSYPSMHWNNPESETLFLSTDYNIDTIKNGWDVYVGNENFNKLFREVHSYIFRQKYSNFCILSIRKK